MKEDIYIYPATCVRPHSAFAPVTVGELFVVLCMAKSSTRAPNPLPSHLKDRPPAILSSLSSASKDFSSPGSLSSGNIKWLFLSSWKKERQREGGKEGERQEENFLNLTSPSSFTPCLSSSSQGVSCTVTSTTSPPVSSGNHSTTSALVVFTNDDVSPHLICLLQRWAGFVTSSSSSKRFTHLTSETVFILDSPPASLKALCLFHQFLLVSLKVPKPRV